MKLINQSAQYLPQQGGIDGIYKQIELAGRTSYLSWDKMTDDSAKKFVDMLIKSHHTSVLEHGTVYLYDTYDVSAIGSWSKSIGKKYSDNKYSKVNHDGNMDIQGIHITTNLRVLQENGWLDDLKHLCEPTKFHEKRLPVKVITDIGVTREFNRHRTFSIVEQSTRYCNLSKNGISFIKPYWYDEKEDYSNDDISKSDFDTMCDFAERNYNILIGTLKKPQMARTVLPLCTKTEVVYTAFESDWRHFFDLRLLCKTGEPHPQIKQLAELIKQEFEKAGVWEGIMKYPSKYE